MVGQGLCCERGDQQTAGSLRCSLSSSTAHGRQHGSEEKGGEAGRHSHVSTFSLAFYSQVEPLDRPRKLPPELADRPEQLVPIRLEFDVEHHKMRETFVWNLNGPFLHFFLSASRSVRLDPVITPEMFAQTLVEDYALAPAYHSVITKSIQEQLSDFKAHVASIDTDWRPPAIEIHQSDGPGAEQDDSDVEVVHRPQRPALEHDDDAPCIDDGMTVRRGTLDEEAVQWWESWRKRAKKEVPTRIVSTKRKKRKISVKVESDEASGSKGKGKERPRTVDEFEVDEKKVHEDLRILIKVGLRRGVAGAVLIVR